MEKELEYLGKAVGHSERPYVAIVGGAKVSDKIELLQNMMKFADSVLIGGAMAYTFLKAQGVEVGLSKVEADKLDLAKALLQFAERRSIEFRLPTDDIVAEKLDASAAVLGFACLIPSIRRKVAQFVIENYFAKNGSCNCLS